VQSISQAPLAAAEINPSELGKLDIQRHRRPTSKLARCSSTAHCSLWQYYDAQFSDHINDLIMFNRPVSCITVRLTVDDGGNMLSSSSFYYRTQ